MRRRIYIGLTLALVAIGAWRFGQPSVSEFVPNQGTSTSINSPVITNSSTHNVRIETSFILGDELGRQENEIDDYEESGVTPPAPN